MQHNHANNHQKAKMFFSHSCIFYFGHACPKLIVFLIFRLAGKRATQKNNKNLRNPSLSCL